MRRPTSEDEALAWWRAAIASQHPPRYDGCPEPGYYTRRFVKGGPLVPVRIYWWQDIDPVTGELRQDEKLVAECEGRSVDPERIWSYCRPVSENEYYALTERAETMAIMAATHAPIDLSETPVLPGE